MCGIVGYVGTQQAAPLLLDGLRRLEYRGYDSSGIATIADNKIYCVKTKGRVKDLILKSKNCALLPGNTGIGHTRWATHGKATDLNAHPFLSADGMFAVAHNGIIENYTGLKAFLSEKGFSLVSDTDSEVVPMLLEYFYDGDVLKAIRRAVSELEGAFSLAIITSRAPDCVFAARKDSSLAIGCGKGCSFVSSDIPALSGFAEQCCIPDENSVAVLRKGEIKLFDRQGNRTAPSFKPTGECGGDAEKGDFPFFMLKEIFSQPRCLTDAAAQFTDGKRLKKILFSDEEFPPKPSLRESSAIGTYFATKKLSPCL